MPNFLLGLEYNLETTLLAAGISFVLAAGLVWLMMAATCRSRLTQLRMTLEKEITTSEQQRMQLGTDLNNLQQKIQQTELKATEQTAQIAQLEKDKQAAQTQAERTLTLESSLNQKNQELAQLTQRVQESEKIRTQLQQAQQSWQTNLAEKEAILAEKEVTLGTLTATVDEQTAQIIQLEQNLQEQQTHLVQAQQANTEQQQQLDHATLQLQQLEQQLLTAQTAKPPVLTESVETWEQQQARIQLQESHQALEEKLADNESVIKELQAALATAQAEPKPAAINDPDLTKKLSDQQATIASLNTTLAEQANYLFRLEYDLEVKKSIINNRDYPLQGIPAAIVAKQEAAQVRIDELEQLLSPKQKATKKTLEKTQSKSSELLNPAKQQLEEIADKAKHLPDRFKGFYQKILTKKQ